MTRKVTTVWRLRQVMAERGLFQTTELVPLLADRGVNLSREQVFRLVTQPPQRLSMDTLAALCDILGCGVADLIEVVPVHQAERAKAAGDRSSGTPTPRTTIRRPQGL